MTIYNVLIDCVCKTVLDCRPTKIKLYILFIIIIYMIKVKTIVMLYIFVYNVYDIYLKL